MLARALSEQPQLGGAGAAAELAYHWYAAGELPEALAASVAAGLAAEDVHAFGDGLLHYERALKVWDAAGDAVHSLPADRIEVLRRVSSYGGVWRAL